MAKSEAAASTAEQSSGLSFADAAERLLRATGKPLTHKELAKRALAQKLSSPRSLRHLRSRCTSRFAAT